MKGSDLFSSKNHLYAIYNNVDGLTEAKPVLVNGFQVGMVNKLSLLPNGEVLIRFDIAKSVKIPKNTQARLGSVDLLGNKAIILIIGNSRELSHSGDTLESINQKSLLESLLPLQTQTGRLISHLDTFLSSINSVINPRFQHNIDKSMSSVSGILKNLEKVSQKFNDSIRLLTRSMENIEAITRNFKNNDKNISSSLENVKKFTEKISGSTLDSTLIQLNHSSIMLKLILYKINSGAGSMGALINDKTLYNNLAASSASLNNLMIDLKANPKRYVHFSIFGSKDKKNVSSVESKP